MGIVKVKTPGGQVELMFEGREPSSADVALNQPIIDAWNARYKHSDEAAQAAMDGNPQRAAYLNFIAEDFDPRTFAQNFPGKTVE